MEMLLLSHYDIEVFHIHFFYLRLEVSKTGACTSFVDIETPTAIFSSYTLVKLAKNGLQSLIDSYQTLVFFPSPLFKNLAYFLSIKSTNSKSPPFLEETELAPVNSLIVFSVDLTFLKKVRFLQTEEFVIRSDSMASITCSMICAFSSVDRCSSRSSICLIWKPPTKIWGYDCFKMFLQSSYLFFWFDFTESRNCLPVSYLVSFLI